jgi:hypothetical protein
LPNVTSNCRIEFVVRLLYPFDFFVILYAPFCDSYFEVLYQREPNTIAKIAGSDSIIKPDMNSAPCASGGVSGSHIVISSLTLSYNVFEPEKLSFKMSSLSDLFNIEETRIIISTGKPQLGRMDFDMLSVHEVYPLRTLPDFE